MAKIETMFLLCVNEDGTLTSYTEIPAEIPETNRVATNWDVYNSAKQIVEEFDRQLLVDRVLQGVATLLTPPAAPAPSDKVKGALKKRGIDPESATIAE